MRGVAIDVTRGAGGVVGEAGNWDWLPPTGAPIARAEAEKFLSALAAGITPTGAARKAGIGRRTFYDLRDRDLTFAAAWDAARQAAIDALEDSAFRRAVEGVEEPVFYKGEVVGTVRRPSDRLMELLLKAERPDKYRERVDHTVTAVPMTAEQLAAARAAGMDPEVAAASATIAALPVVEGTAREA